MDKFTTQEYDLLNGALDEIATTSTNILQRAERSYTAIKLSLQRLKEFILSYTFMDRQEEVLFFKEIKPQFLKELIYYRKIFYIEAGKPLGDREALTKYYKQETARINLFIERNHSFYIYYRMGKSDKDEQYFVRMADGAGPLPEYSLDIDPQFCTIHSLKLAKMQACEMLNEYLLSELHKIDNPLSPPDLASIKSRRDITWTDPKVDLIELGYSIQSRGSVNHGKADVKLIMTALEYAFNVSTGNYYAVFQQNIRIRKKSRTVYLNGLKDSLEKRMDDSDE
jgi:hypothetical protein